MKTPLMVAFALTAALVAPAGAQSLESRVKDGYADSNGMKIHYATIGTGPLLVTVPTADHFVQADAPEFVTKTIRGWLLR